MSSGIERIHRGCPFVYASVRDWLNNVFIVVTSALLRALGWAMLKPDKTGGGEMEARKADHVERPNASEMIVIVGMPLSCRCIACKSCCAICPAVGFHSH